MTDIRHRGAERLKTMEVIFELADGSEYNRVDITDVVSKAALPEQDVLEACQYLSGEGLIDVAKGFGGLHGIHHVSLNHPGIREFEDSQMSPQEPTEHFPALSIVQHFHGDVSDAVFQQASPGASQTLSHAAPDLTSLAAFIHAYREQEAFLELESQQAEDLRTDVATMEVQLQSARPRMGILQECTTDARLILTTAVGGTMGSVAAVPLLQLLHNVGWL
jgi:hypothetical protein